MSFMMNMIGVLQCISSSICICVYCFIIYVLTKTTIFHSTFRATFRIFSVSVIFSMVITVYLVLDCFLGDNCSRVMVVPLQKDLRHIVLEIQDISVYSYWLALTLVSSERAFASYFVNSYEKRFHSLQSLFAIILTFLIIGAVQNISAYFFPFATLSFVCGFQTTACVVVVYIVRTVNVRRNKIGDDLSTRFQVRENVMLSTSMFPLMAFCFLSQLALLPLVYLFLTESVSDRRELFISLLQFCSSIFLVSYAIGFVRSAAMRKAMATLGIGVTVVAVRRNDKEQYAQWMQSQQTAWRVN